MAASGKGWLARVREFLLSPFTRRKGTGTATTVGKQQGRTLGKGAAKQRRGSGGRGNTAPGPDGTPTEAIGRKGMPPGHRKKRSKTRGKR